MAENEQAVFISYAWGGESEKIANQIDRALQQRRFKIIRDKRDLGYKGSISQFMERIGQSNCVIVVISDKYLRSSTCMFELVEIVEGKQFYDRIFLIVLADAEIYDPVKRLGYVKYWEEKRSQLAAAMKDVDPGNLQSIREDMDLYDRIRDKVSELTSILKEMNTLTPEMHRDSDFSALYDGIEIRLKSVGLPKGEKTRRLQEAERTVFLSYAWTEENERVTNEIDIAVQNRGIRMIRSTHSLDDKDSIREFIEQIGDGSYFIVIISDSYLRTKNCMFELIQLVEIKQFYDRIFAIVLADADIYDPVKRLGYVKYWEEKRRELAAAMKDADPSNLQSIREDMDLHDRIRDTTAGLTSILKDMATLTPEMHRDSDFSALYKALERQMASDGLQTRQQTKAKKVPAKKRTQPSKTPSSTEPESIPTTSELIASSISEKEEDGDTETEDTPETQSARQLQAAIAANLLANNRSQAVFNDRAQGEDQLGIKNEVEALAETLLLRDVEPPVAVGVMGGWGSGKSFVMYLIDQYVQRIRAQKVKKGWADSDEQDPKIPVFVGHVYQIHFNAWTYAKSNLWASLMDTIFLNLNRQMQIEQLLAHRDCDPKDTTNLADDIRNSMLRGGGVFTKIYGESLKFDQDKDLEECKENLDYWAHHLFKGNLLWSVMRRRQEENLDRLKDTEEQLKQLKSGREEFEKTRSPEKKSVKLDASTAKGCAQTMLTTLVAFIPDQVNKTAIQSLQKQNVTEDDIHQALKEIRDLSGLIDTLREMFREYRSLRILTILFLLAGLALLVLPIFHMDFIGRKLAVMASWLAVILPFIPASLSWWQKVSDFSVKAKVILEDAYKNQQSKHAEEIANSTKKSPDQKIADLQIELSQGSLAAYDTLINLLEAQAEAERQLIGPSAKYSSLMEFVQSRLDAATYENQLGLMHQVRQDIDELTYSLVDGAREDIFPRGKPRVILYIDDLDRCPPARVVEILEAVQLLLNTKLFIIILGLDTRYVTRALEKEYKEILQHEGDPSGLDYIEKIIQIPYRVRAIEKDNLRQYIGMQMDIEKPPEPEPAAITTPPVQDQQSQEQSIQQQLIEDQPSQDEPRIETKVPSQTAEQVQPPPVDTQPEQEPQTLSQSISQQPVSPPPVETKAPEPPRPLEIELPAAVIQFKQEDLEDLAICCQKIMLTPRSIKRLVNVFKLMKIFWFRADKDAGIAERDRPRAVKQAAMSLLALSSAYPEVMREVFVHLDVLYRQGQEKTELFTALNNIKLPPGSANELSWQLQKYKADVSALKAIVGNGQDKFGQLVLQDLKLSTFNIVRSFSFVGDPVYWTDDEDEGSPRLNGNAPAKPSPKVKRTRKPPSLAG